VCASHFVQRREYGNESAQDCRAFLATRQLETGGSHGTVAPQLVDRVTAGTVGFSFNAPFTIPVSPGTTSTVLIIQTNATNFEPGAANIIDGSVASVGAFAPSGTTTRPTPEPSSLMLFGTGLLTVAGALRRKLLS
jgi:PEP-CTERM motif